MYIVTGGAGFIGSACVAKLNQLGIEEIWVVDRLGTGEKWRNLVNLRFAEFVHKDEFLRRVREECLPDRVEAILHLGACSATTERDADYLMENNVHYTRHLAEWALAHGVRFVYASSAATYGDGSLGYADDHAATPALRPLNMYGYSKQLFDLWALRTGAAGRIAGVKFFNVFGPNEYHKGAMASLLFKAYHQIIETGEICLFKSDHPDYADGEQQRDFLYVKDAVEMVWWLVEHPAVNGLYNCGTGSARSWVDLANALFAAMRREPKIRFIEMPEHLRGKYQYFTEARMEKVRAAGFDRPFTSLEAATADYVTYLERDLATL